MLVHAVPTKIYFFNALPRTLCFAWKKAAVTHMRVDGKLWDKGWYFAIRAAIFGNIINSSTSSKCGARNVVRLKEQLNKKKLLARAFPRFYMQRECRKGKRLRVKDTQTMWNIFKLVVLHRFAESGFESGGLKTRYRFSLLWKQKTAI